MADRQQPHQLQVHPQRHYQDTGVKSLIPEKGPSTSKVLAVITLLPIGGTLLLLSGLTLAGTLLSLAITTPLFIIFSPVLVPAALTIGLAVTAFLTSGVFGLTACSSLSWVFSYLQKAAGEMPEQLEQAKKRMQEMTGYAGQRTKEVGQEMQGKAQDQPGRRT